MPVNLLANETTPYIFWKNKSQEEKISFINGAYGAISVLKKHHSGTAIEADARFRDFPAAAGSHFTSTPTFLGSVW